jgi:hypothetical protein
MNERLQCNNEITLEVKGAWYYPVNNDFRDIFGYGTGMYTLEGNYQLFCNWYAYGSGSFFYSNDRSVVLLNLKRNVWFLPITLGVKYLDHFCFCDYLWAWYFGAGGVGTYADLDDQYDGDANGWGGGANLQLGGMWYANPNFYVDLFAQYTFNYIPNKHIIHNLSGVSIGAGLGWSF